MAIEYSFTSEVKVFVALVASAANDGDKGEMFFHVSTLSKDDSYVLDNITWTKLGRELLASGGITTEQTDNTPLVLRILMAAMKTEG